MGGEQDSGADCACSGPRGSEAATMEATPSFNKRRRFRSRSKLRSLLCCRSTNESILGLRLGSNSIVPPPYDHNRNCFVSTSVGCLLLHEMRSLGERRQAGVPHGSLP